VRPSFPLPAPLVRTTLSVSFWAVARFEENLQVNILVTGAAGYIGCVCAEVLVARGMSVIALDSLVEAIVPPCLRAPSFAKWTSRTAPRSKRSSLA